MTKGKKGTSFLLILFSLLVENLFVSMDSSHRRKSTTASDPSFPLLLQEEPCPPACVCRCPRHFLPFGGSREESSVGERMGEEGKDARLWRMQRRRVPQPEQRIVAEYGRDTWKRQEEHLWATLRRFLFSPISV